MGLFKRRKRAAPPAHRLLSYQAANLQGRGTRERQEDAFAFANALDVTEIRRRGLLAVVADGMGGLKDGRLASQACVAQILSSFAGLDPDGDVAGQLLDWADRANDDIHGRFGGESGTTLAVGLLLREALWWVSVGDSGLYLLREGVLVRLNRDQNHLARVRLEAIRAGRLDPDIGLDDPDGPRLSHFLGDERVEEMDRSLRPLPLAEGDTLLLCSDGVSGVLDGEDLGTCLSAPTAEEACARLEDAVLAQARRNQDNYTALVVKCGY